MHNWLPQHAQALSLVIGRLRAQTLSTLLICAVIGVTVAIPSLMYVAIHNVSQLVSEVKKDAQMSVFLKPDIDRARVQSLEKTLTNHPAIASARFVAKKEALNQLIASSNNPELIATLDNNPLPDAFFIQPKSIEKATIDALKTELNTLDGVAEVIVDSGWMNRLNSLLGLGQQAAWLLGLLLGFGLIAVISNTIRMQILTHKEEIEVSRLIGATNSFIRRPFLYLGTLYGMGGGLLACCILWLVVTLFNQTVTQIAAEYQSDFAIEFALVPTFFNIFSISVLVGWLAAYAAVSYQPAQSQ
ncbi:MAG TPA: permease-like cell division protein FtsX [Methylophilus sp.]